MKRDDIANALKARLANGGIGINGAWPNVGYGGTKPYFEVQNAAANRSQPALNGGTLYEEGRLSVAVIVDVDTGETAANDCADAVSALYPKGLSIIIPNGAVTITGPATIAPGYRDEADWRVPVTIPYRARTI